MKNKTNKMGFLGIAVITAAALAFTACAEKPPEPFTDLNAITTYLADAKGGTLDKPLFMIINIPLGDMTNAGSGWQRLLMIIENAGKNVSLDLSGSQMVGTEFNPVSNVSSGKFFIVSLVLPDAAKSIIGNRDSSSFVHFYNLKTAAGKEITSISRNAFKDCSSLTVADFPLIANIAEGAFSGCTSLESVSFPLVTSIGNEAFYNCSSLTGINIPLASSIGESAFDDCTSMVSASFPASASIVYNPFRGCSSLTSFTLSGVGDLGVIEGGKALVRNETDLIAYPSASGSIVMENITSLGRSAFNGNASLSSVDFPSVTDIGIRAFRGCTSLIGANFPAVTSIGLGAFESTGTTAFTITLGNTAPTVGGSIFAGVTGEKPVTVRAPFGATGYGQSPSSNWGNRFRDWNTNIELTIEFMAEEAQTDESAQ
ncbi:MAG: leucine-rich repeat domain-containing protein [Treponema sp.]|nr:leucine-rich repeat domain-containing protein [Treponema sp.]